jgi:2-polyprenyl-6-methoxyphenol hydroxylase-like FAD-dependent oxidoreductase
LVVYAHDPAIFGEIEKSFQMKIAICGCGIGGISVAILARRIGSSVTLFDQFEVPEPVGSGLVIQPVGLRVLKQLVAANAALA